MGLVTIAAGVEAPGIQVDSTAVSHGFILADQHFPVDPFETLLTYQVLHALESIMPAIVGTDDVGKIHTQLLPGRRESARRA